MDEGRLGIEHMAEHGIISRGVLLDLPDYCLRLGRACPPNERLGVDGAMLEGIAVSEGVAFEPGDALVLPTGWVDWFMGLDEAQRQALQGTVQPGSVPGALACPGLDPGPATAAWLWDHRIAAVATDGRYDCMLSASPLNVPGGVGSPANAHAIR